MYINYVCRNHMNRKVFSAHVVQLVLGRVSNEVITMQPGASGDIAELVGQLYDLSS